MIFACILLKTSRLTVWQKIRRVTISQYLPLPDFTMQIRQNLGTKETLGLSMKNCVSDICEWALHGCSISNTSLNASLCKCPKLR